MSWTRTGTLNVTNGSTAVAGVGTAWLTDQLTRAGDTLDVGGVLYEVAAPPSSDTALTLVTPYAGSTASGLSYAIIHTGLLPSVLAKNLSDLQAKYLVTIAQLLAWETATAGTVPITDPGTGVTTNVRPLQVAAATTSVWRSGLGVPSNALGSDGDYYLETASGDTYLRTAGAYAFNVNIKGPAGAAGATGPQGPQGIQGPAGGAYTLPVASTTVLGGVKAGSGVTIDAAGVISAAGGSSGGAILGMFPGLTTSAIGTQRVFPGKVLTIAKVSAWCGVAAPSDTTLTVKVNGAAVASAVITAGTTAGASGALSLAVAATDYITIDISSTGALDVGCRIDYA